MNCELISSEHVLAFLVNLSLSYPLSLFLYASIVWLLCEVPANRSKQGNFTDLTCQFKSFDAALMSYKDLLREREREREREMEMCVVYRLIIN